MSMLDVSLLAAAVLLWGGNIVLYFRKPIFAWFDNRIRYEPLLGRLRAARAGVRRRRG